MAYKTIIVHVDNSARSAERVKIAAQLAIDNGAHLIGLATTGWSSLLVAGAANDAMLPPVLAELEPFRASCRSALAAFEQQARALGVDAVESRMVEEEAGLALAMHGRYCDLVVLGQARGVADSPLVRPDFPEYVLLNCSTPVLVVPAAGPAAAVGRKVALAWNGSPEARRAISSAIPLLQRAESVFLVMINPERAAMYQGDEPGADMALYLARHGIRVEVVRHSDAPAADQALIDAAAACGADLMVMGAYGRSRFREFLLGGATRTLLESMAVPLWMAH